MCQIETPRWLTGQVSDPPCVYLVALIIYALTAELDFGLHPSGAAMTYAYTSSEYEAGPLCSIGLESSRGASPPGGISPYTPSESGVIGGKICYNYIQPDIVTCLLGPRNARCYPLSMSLTRIFADVRPWDLENGTPNYYHSQVLLQTTQSPGRLICMNS
jgi:hypothetical protein